MLDDEYLEDIWGQRMKVPDEIKNELEIVTDHHISKDTVKEKNVIKMKPKFHLLIKKKIKNKKNNLFQKIINFIKRKKQYKFDVEVTATHKNLYRFDINGLEQIKVNHNYILNFKA